MSDAGSPVVSREEWLAARKALLAREKEATHLRDEVNAERLALPWVKVEKDYLFDTPAGAEDLADLFDGRSQLIVYHFMLGPDWAAGCPGCSFLADHLDGALPHLNHHDVTLVAVSRAPLAKIEAYKRRMGWQFPWVSSFGSDFNYDYHVSFTQGGPGQGERSSTTLPKRRPSASHDELPGLSAFYQERRRRGVPHLFELRARAGGADRHADDPRPRAQGPQRGQDHGFRPPPRRIRRRGESARLTFWGAA